MKIFYHDKGVFWQCIISPSGPPDGEMMQFRQNDSGRAGAFSRRKEKAAGPTVYFVYTEGPQRSMTEKDLPRGLLHAGDLALIGQLAEADTADAVVAQVSVGTTAELAAGVFTGGILLRLLLL